MVVGFGLYKLMGEKSTEVTRYLETLCGLAVSEKQMVLSDKVDVHTLLILHSALGQCWGEETGPEGLSA